MDPREVQAILAWSGLPHVGEKTLLALMDHARMARSGLAALWEAPLADLTRLVRLHPKSVAALDDDGAHWWGQATETRDEIRARGVDLLTPSQPDYPAALLQAAERGRRWPLLFAYGALSLLDEPRVALVNSQTVSNSGLAVTEALADALARRDTPLVTSTNKESYQAAATAAKRHAGPTLFVLDRGIAEAFPAGLEREPVPAARVWDEAFDPDLQLLLSPFPWRGRWRARTGPTRDALIFDLANVVVAVDVREGGVMERECRTALAAGKPVLAIDRGPDTDLGTRALWEAGARRFRWSGAEDAAGEVLRLLSGQAPAAGEDRSSEGRLTEVGQFLARACALLSPLRPPEAVAAYPASGPLAKVAGRWSGREARAAAGAGWLLADLTGEASGSPARLGQLMERVSPLGLLAAVLPASWLDAAEFGESRAGWLRTSALRLAVRLPAAPGPSRPQSAAVVLERDGVARGEAPAFAPEREQMGRFHLRRYLCEVLAALSARAGG